MRRNSCSGVINERRLQEQAALARRYGIVMAITLQTRIHVGSCRARQHACTSRSSSGITHQPPSFTPVATTSPG